MNKSISELNKSISLKNIVLIAGTMCAYWIGAGFSTGQEVVQYFAIHGIKGIVSILFFAIITGVSLYFVCSTGQREQFANPYDIFEYYGGKWIGKFYIWLSTIAIYTSLFVILAGGGASLNQYYGVPTFIGLVLIAFFAWLTAVLGLQKLIDILGVIGPLKVLFVLVLGVYGIVSLVNHPGITSEANALISTAGFKSVSPNWAWSALLYAFLCTFNIVPLLSACGATAKSPKEAGISAVVGTVTFAVTLAILAFTELVNYKLFMGKQVPTLVIADRISPVFSMLFMFMIIIAVYSVVASHLLITTRKFAVDKTKKFNILATVLIIVATVTDLFISFTTLVNILFPIIGYAAIAFICLIVYKEIKIKLQAKNKCSDAECCKRDGN